MPSTSSATTSRPKPKPRSRPALQMFPHLPAAEFAGAQRQECCTPPQKTKRLKTRKERNQIRGPYISSFFQSHGKRGSQDKAQSCGCQESHSGHFRNRPRKDKPVAKPFLPRRPSIITDGRLTSMKGLFSHEVRSVDIERLVADRRSRNQGENHQVEAPASNSPPCQSPSPFSLRPEISRCVQGDQKSPKKSKRSRNELTSKQTDHFKGNAEEHAEEHSTQACKEAVERVVGSRRKSNKKETEHTVPSSAESEDLFQSFSTPDKANKSDPPVPPREQQEEQASTTTTAMDQQQGSHHTLTRSSQPDSAVRSGSPPALAVKGQQKKPGAQTTREAVGRLAARLCQTLRSPPSRRRCPLLTECIEVLQQTLEERNSQSRLHLQPSAELLVVSQAAEQASSSSEQRYGDSTTMQFSFLGGYEGGQQSGSPEIWADNSSQREFVRADVSQDIKRGTVDGKRRPQTWMLYSPQDFLTKLRSPCEDMGKRQAPTSVHQLTDVANLDQWNVRVPLSESLRANHLHNPLQEVSLLQACTGIETPTPYSYSCEAVSTEPCFLKPQKQAKLSLCENTVREITELLDLWSSDPDLAFLFQENERRSHTPSALSTVLKASSPRQQMESARGRPFFGALSAGSAFFPPEGFSYKPYYRFPHPPHCTNRSERSESSSVTAFNHSDLKDLGLSPSLLLKTPYFRFSL
ncbi:proline-rich protein 19 [Salminus brasiliensis]|uniref:proline-rich protein 19 n=1 Tax=Salminus brasiliensis TaxID=930266 RepID=UPI003B8334B2